MVVGCIVTSATARRDGASACRCVSHCQIRIYVKRTRSACAHAFMQRIIRAGEAEHTP